MDTTKAITHVSLCAGYGGIDLGLKRAIPSLRTIAFSEIEAFACANLVSKMEAGLLDPAPIWTNLKTFPWSEFHGCVDILSGGYPCQPFSAAGKRLGAEDPRHLWPFIAAGIAAMRPGACFFENVEGHCSLGLPDVLQDLAGMGYRTTWGVFSASEVGAPHQRKRVFILAYDTSLGIQGRWPSWIEESRPHAGQALPVRGGEGCGELADAGSERSSRARSKSQPSSPIILPCDRIGEAWPSRPGEQQYEWEPPRVVANGQRPERRPDNIGTSGQGHQEAGAAGACGETGTLADSKSQRAGQRSELRSEECGSRGALPWDVEQSGEGGTVANAGSITRRQTGRQLQPEELDEARRNAEANELGSGDQAMGNAQRLRPQGRDITGGVQEVGASRAEPAGDGCGELGDAAHANRWTGDSQAQAGARPDSKWRRRLGESGQWQTEPSMGLLPDGSADGLGGPNVSGLSDQELAEIRDWMVTSTNRTDSLRLLGNGVVPATAERAFRVLVGELMEEAP